MLNRFTLLVIAVTCFAASVSAYEPLTTEEALEYVQRFPDAAAEDVIALDTIEHADPTVDVPTYTVVVAGDEIILTPRSPLTIDVGSVGWAITLPEQRAMYEPETHSRFADIATSALVGFALGALTILLVW